jgi:CP family cyanate transporter-like MFS transporter
VRQASRRGRGLLAVGALVLAAVNLRPGVASIGPLLPAISNDLGLSSAQAGMLTTIPTLCMAACAPLAARLAARIGTERVLAWSAAVIGAALAFRLAGHAAAVLFATAVVLGIGSGFTQTLLPAVVKARFARRAVVASGAYALSINLGAALAAGASIPVAHALDSWEASLALWSLLAPVTALAWLLLARRSTTRSQPVPSGLPWRSWTAWKVMLEMAGMATAFIVVLTWLAPLYQDLGYGEARAGLVLAVFAAMQIVGGIVVPPLAQRSDRRLRWLAGSSLVMAAGLAGVAVAPEASPWLWACAIGAGMGAGFPLILVLFVDHARSPEEAGRLTAMGFVGSYALAAAAPAGAGAIRDATGSLALPFAITAAIALLMAAGAVALRHPRQADALQ